LTDAVDPPAKATTPKSRRLQVLEAVSWAATGIGVIFVAIQMYQAQQDRQVDAALELAAQFAGLELSDQRRVLARVYLENEAELAMLQRAVMTPEALAELVEKRLLTSSHDDPTTRDAETTARRLAVLEISDTFDRIALCALDGGGWFSGPRCDEGVIASYFCDYAQGFHTLYGAYLRKISSSFGSDTGAGVRRLAESELCKEY
jgi:hypothetical protein